MTDQPTDYEALAQRIEGEVEAASPGPWATLFENYGGDYGGEGQTDLAGVISADDLYVFRYDDDYGEGSKRGANAALAAAAPQRALALAQALRALSRAGDYVHDELCRSYVVPTDHNSLCEGISAALAAILESEETP